MSEFGRAGEAAVRVADTLLRTVGGRRVMLRVPSPATAGDVTEQLGLAVPTFQDIPLYPAVYRKARSHVAEGKAAQWELLVSATAVETLVGSLAYESASVLFATAYGVLSDDSLLAIASATAEQISGKPYAYRLVLNAPLAEIV
jgi:hypothetical protein